jgi:regulator of sigma E protease
MADHEIIATMPAEVRAVSFFAQKVWKRAAIVAAGPIANFILAIVIFATIFFAFGREVLNPRVQEVRAGEAGAIAGFEPGDLVIAIDGKPVSSWSAMQRVIQASADVPLTFTVDRGTKQITLQATPKVRELKTPFGTQRIGMIGLTAASSPSDWRLERYSPTESLALAARETWFVVERTGAFIVG